MIEDPAKGGRAAYLAAYLMASDLVAVGIDVDCLPIADVPIVGASSVIGDRAYGETAEKVATIARRVADGLLECGVLPVLKHIPGHGRAGQTAMANSPLSRPTALRFSRPILPRFGRFATSRWG